MFRERVRFWERAGVESTNKSAIRMRFRLAWRVGRGVREAQHPVKVAGAGSNPVRSIPS